MAALDFLHDYVGGKPPSNVVFFSGAGISANPPTSLPLGAGLLERVLQHFFEAGTLDVVLGYHRALGLRSSTPCDQIEKTRLPRLETVLGVAARVHGLTRALSVLGDMRTAAPNALHAFFASHILLGGRHITANFDMCIEALLPSTFDISSGLWHFHGAIGPRSTQATLGATLNAVERGFDPNSTARLHELLSFGDTLMFFGYSGSDFFDIDPAVAAMPSDAMSGRRVLWIAHASTTGTLRPAEHHDPPLLSLLRAAGADVATICAPTTEVCVALADIWLPPISLQEHRSSAAPVRAPPVQPETSALASFELYRELRLHREVRNRIRVHAEAMSPVDLWRTEADLLWESGRFKKAMVRWARSGSRVQPWERNERIGATLWQQGRLMPAWAWLTFHRRRLGVGAPRLRTLETEGRVVLHMLQTPELRWLGRRLALGVQSLLEGTDRTVGLHMYRRAHDVSSQLKASVAVDGSSDTVDDGEGWFLEAGDLTAVLAYRHARYRRASIEGVPDRELADRYLTLERDKNLVGAIGTRTRHLPGSERVWSFRQYALSLLESEFGWWNRCRLLLRYAYERRQNRLRDR